MRPTEPAAVGDPRTGGGTVEQAKTLCLRLLTAKARPRTDLRNRLLAKGFSESVIEAALDRLTEVGLIDDADYARQWVAARQRSGRGRMAIRRELAGKGIGTGVVDEVLTDVDEDAEIHSAAEVVRRKLRSTTVPVDRLERDKLLRRLVGALTRRGFSAATALSVARGELDRADPNADGDDFPLE